MKKEEKLINKVKLLLRRANIPRFLHRFGPKKYEFAQHLQALLVRAYCRLSYRRTRRLYDLFGLICPSKSSLQYTAKKLNVEFWNNMLKITCGSSYTIAIDSSGFSRSSPSYHYLKRINGKPPKIPIKLSIAFDTAKKKFKAAKIRVQGGHDVKDAKFLILQSKPKVLVADKGYDSGDIHDLCAWNKIKVHIPIREYKGKVRHNLMSNRRKNAKLFRERTYHRRSLVESAFSLLKRKLGFSVNSKYSCTVKSEIYSRLLSHNLLGRFNET